MKNDCPKFQKWLEKKDKSISFVCYESNMVDVNHNTWWIDSGSTIHITNTLQGLQKWRPLEIENDQKREDSPGVGIIPSNGDPDEAIPPTKTQAAGKALRKEHRS